MIRRVGGNLALRREPAPEASLHLERDGYAVLREGLAPAEVEAPAAEAGAVFALFVSDAWRRGTPAKRFGRFFLQAHYARRCRARKPSGSAG